MAFSLSSLVPSRSVLSGGLGGVVAYVALQFAKGYFPQLTDEQITLLVPVIGGIITQLVPDSLKDHAKALDVKLSDLAAIIPTTSPVYPGTDGKPPISNQPKWQHKDDK